MPADRTRICPACLSTRVDEGPSHTHEYDDGLWVGCTRCGFAVSGPDPDIIRAAWVACCRSTRLRNLAA